MSLKNFNISYGMNDKIATTQLGYDAFHGHIKLIKAAIEANIDWTSEGVEAIHGSIFGSQRECFEVLLVAGSPVNSYTHYLLHKILPDLYKKYFFDSKFKSLLDKSTATQNLVDASSRGSVELCVHFLSAGADPNDDSYGVLPLVSAARRLQKDLISVLLAHKAEINNVGKGNYSPLRVLASSGSHMDKALKKEIFDYLVGCGAIAIPAFKGDEEAAAKQGDFVSLF